MNEALQCLGLSVLERASASGSWGAGMPPGTAKPPQASCPG